MREADGKKTAQKILEPVGVVGMSPNRPDQKFRHNM
jgi:hypothetical protein